jgi:hypothetical protein
MVNMSKDTSPTIGAAGAADVSRRKISTVIAPELPAPVDKLDVLRAAFSPGAEIAPGLATPDATGWGILFLCLDKYGDEDKIKMTAAVDLRGGNELKQRVEGA